MFTIPSLPNFPGIPSLPKLPNLPEIDVAAKVTANLKMTDTQIQTMIKDKTEFLKVKNANLKSQFDTLQAMGKGKINDIYQAVGKIKIGI